MGHLSLSFIMLMMAFGGSNAQEVPPLVDVLPGEMPYHVSIQHHNSFWGSYDHSASGIILDETHVLTVTPFWPMESLSVVSGITHLFSIVIGLGKRHTIKNVFPHPDYRTCWGGGPNRDYPNLNDVFIIEVNEPFDFRTATRKPARLPQPDFTLPTSGVVASWSFGGTSDDALKKATIPIINNTHCEHFFGKYRITENMFCGAFIDENGESYNVVDSLGMGSVITCNEDPNDPQSPIVVCGLMEDAVILNVLCKEPTGPVERDSNGKQLHTDCNSPQGNKVLRLNYPVVFTRISKYLNWINETLSQNHQ